MSQQHQIYTISAIVDDSLLNDYLLGILNTILFVRLLGVVEPSSKIHQFLNTSYPVISNNNNNNNNNNNTSSLYNSSPYEWTIKKVNSIMDSYKRKINSINNNPYYNDEINSLSQIFTKIIFIIKFNKITNTNRIESWIIELNVLNKSYYDSFWDDFVINNIDNINNNENSNFLKFLKLDSSTLKRNFINDSFNDNLFKILKYVDNNKTFLPLINLKLNNLTNFNIKTDLIIDSNLFNNKNFNINNLINSSSMDSIDLDSLSISNSFDKSDESLEYINTNENGDIIMSSSNSLNNDSNIGKLSDDLWKNGYNFLKKMLE
jgi:hypothetical protein